MKHFSRVLLVSLCFASITHANAETLVAEDPLPVNIPKVPFDLKAPNYEASEFAFLNIIGLKKRIGELRKKHGDDKELLEAMTLLAGKKIEPSLCYDLALANARVGDITMAFYWLQRAACEDECSMTDALTANAFVDLRNDPRWEKMKSFLKEAAKAWQEATFHRDVLTLPTGYDRKKEIPLILGLHGYGALPEDFSGEDHQKICDDLNVAFLSVSGSIPLGRNSFMWSAKFEDDWERILQAMKKFEPNIKVRPGNMITVGFSQGGQLAGDLCAAYPEHFRGCIVMSPGSRSSSRLGDALKFGNGHAAGQSYFFSWISGEGDGPKTRSRDNKKLLDAEGATVYLHEFPGKGHSFPNCYADYYSIAIQVILKGR